VVDTLESAPRDATHWSTRGLAAKHGISKTTVAEIWRAFGLKPWRQDHFKVSPDPDLVDKIRDLVGLYMNPPDAAAVFALDEKPQIQALNRTAPTLPMLPTTPQRATHDYERHGTVDLFAALDMARGTVNSDIRSSHNQDDFLAFMNKINREVPDGLAVHAISRPGSSRCNCRSSAPRRWPRRRVVAAEQRPSLPRSSPCTLQASWFMVTADNRERFEPTDAAILPSDLAVDSEEICGSMASAGLPGRPRSRLPWAALSPSARPGRGRVVVGRPLPCLPSGANIRPTLL
jgi:hypothetical protein